MNSGFSSSFTISSNVGRFSGSCDQHFSMSFLYGSLIGLLNSGRFPEVI